jgi:hypothetical protein
MRVGDRRCLAADLSPIVPTEEALRAKIKCKDFKKNLDDTWTSGPNAKIGTNAFSNHTFDIGGVCIGDADLATV